MIEERNTYIEKCLKLIRMHTEQGLTVPEKLIGKLTEELDNMSLSSIENVKVIVEVEGNEYWKDFTEEYDYLNLKSKNIKDEKDENIYIKVRELYNKEQEEKLNKRNEQVQENVRRMLNERDTRVKIIDEEKGIYSVYDECKNEWVEWTLPKDKLNLGKEIDFENINKYILQSSIGSGKTISCVNLLKHINDISSKYIEINPEKEYEVDNNLKELLVRKGLSQVDVAKQMNVSVKTLNNIVAQKANTSIEVALKLSHILQEPIENIFSLGEKMKLIDDK